MQLRQFLTDIIFKDEAYLNMKNAVDYLGIERLNAPIPANILHFMNKLLSQKEMQEKDFKSFHHDMSLIQDIKTYNALTYCVNNICRMIYESHKAEINDSVQQIKDNPHKEIKKTQMTNVGLLNVYLINRGEILDLKYPDENDNSDEEDFFLAHCFPDKASGESEIFEYNIPLAINALRLTNKLPSQGNYCGLDLSKHLYPKYHGGTDVEAPLRRGIKNKNEWAPFYKNAKLFKGDLDDTVYLATNGKKLLYIRGSDAKLINSSSIMASKVATFVSKKHFSSERRLNNQLTASKQLPEYKFSFVDPSIASEVREVIKEKRVFVGSGIINEVLNFVHETDPNNENYGLSALPSSSECCLCKIDFDHCSMSFPLPKSEYEMKSINDLYNRQPHVFSDPIFIQETLYARLKLSFLTKELNEGFAEKASDNMNEKNILVNETCNRVKMAFELFLEDKNSRDYLNKNPHILNIILQESLDYTKKHFDEPRLSQINNSLQRRFEEIQDKIKDKLNVIQPLEEKEKSNLFAKDVKGTVPSNGTVSQSAENKHEKKLDGLNLSQVDKSKMLDNIDFKASASSKVNLVPSLFNSKAQKSQDLITLIKFIVIGDIENTKAIIAKNPLLLTEELDEKFKGTAPSGQIFNNMTAYRTALSVGDSQMAKWIKAELIKVAGEDVAYKQYQEQFPKGWELEESNKLKLILSQLDTLTNAIKDSKPDDIKSSGDPQYKLTVKEGSAVAIALKEFTLQLNALMQQKVTTGLHFNPRLLGQAYKIYETHFKDYFGNNSKDPRAILFWQQVIGKIQSVLPVNYVQALCNGMVTTGENLKNNIPQGRSFKMKVFNPEHKGDPSKLYIPCNFYPRGISGI
ncbi:MAG: hypothetical protein JO131_04210, partial [Gammaproteobacteria bacterium]|nr:hypothetical protein [Gammaproteobacteria bacterium]